MQTRKQKIPKKMKLTNAIKVVLVGTTILATGGTADANATDCGSCQGCWWTAVGSNVGCYPWAQATCDAQGSAYVWCAKGDESSPTPQIVTPTPQPTQQQVTPTPLPTQQQFTPTPQSTSGGAINPSCGTCSGCWWTAVGSNVGCYYWAQATCDAQGSAYVWCAKGGEASPTPQIVTPTPQPTQQQATPTPLPTQQLVTPTPQPTQLQVSPTQQPPVNGKKYVMYYPAWATYARDFQITDIDASKLTHINYAFANVKGGECVLGDAYADTQKFFSNTDSWNDAGTPLRGNINQLHELKRKHPHLVNMISIGGWTWSTEFSGLASTKDGRVKFAESCTNYMQQYGFDGLDVDWEFPVSGGDNIPNSPNDRENFTLLLAAMRKSLDAAGKISGRHYPLTIATSADPAKVDTSYNVPEITPLLDFVNVMSYDFNGAWNDRTGHNAPLFPNPEAAIPEWNVHTGVQTFIDHGLPREKLILGLGFYGRGWSNAQSGANGHGLFAPAKGASVGTWEDGVLDYSDLVENYVNKNGFTRYWDDVSKVPYLYNAEKDVFISYDDEESLCHKASYVNAMGLGGGMVWEVSQDYKQSLQKLSFDVIVGQADACHMYTFEDLQNLK